MTDFPTPKLPLSRARSTTGHVWRQADGTVFSATEFADWLWNQLERLREADDIVKDLKYRVDVLEGRLEDIESAAEDHRFS